MEAMILPLILAMTPAAIADTPIVSIDSVIGKGATLKKGDFATVQYKGWLQSSGKVFDESTGKAPFVFKVGDKQVIEGWDTGLIGMKVGGKRYLQLPPDKAYGEKGAGADIPANSTLIFEIELLRVDSKEGKLETEILKAGSGDAVKSGDKVGIHYVGTFINGVKFDSSRDRNELFNIQLGVTGLIKGFTDGVIGMKKGELRKVTIPYNLAYGERGAGGVIPPYSTIVFEIELVTIDGK